MFSKMGGKNESRCFYMMSVTHRIPTKTVKPEHISVNSASPVKDLKTSTLSCRKQEFKSNLDCLRLKTKVPHTLETSGNICSTTQHYILVDAKFHENFSAVLCLLRADRLTNRQAF
jgi:hypothetical protein